MQNARDFRPPRELLTDGVVTLRRWQAGDAESLHHAISSSLRELAPWMPWARRPYNAHDAAGFLERTTMKWKAGLYWSYAITSSGNGLVLGSCGIGPSDKSMAVDAGYWLATEALGQGYATRAVALLTETALSEVGAEVVRIIHDIANSRSALIPQRLGFRRAGEISPDPGHENPENRPDVVWEKSLKNCENARAW